MSDVPENHWNHRVIEFADLDGTPWRQIHEVHYERGRPVLYSDDGAVVSGANNLAEVGR